MKGGNCAMCRLCEGSEGQLLFHCIVNALNTICEQTHESEALGIIKDLCEPSTVSAIIFTSCRVEQISADRGNRLDSCCSSC